MLIDDFTDYPIEREEFTWDGRVRVDYGAKKLVLEVIVRTTHFEVGENTLSIEIGGIAADVVTIWSSQRTVGCFYELPQSGGAVDLCLGGGPYYRCQQRFLRDNVAPIDPSRIDLEMRELEKLKGSGFEGIMYFGHDNQSQL